MNEEPLPLRMTDVSIAHPRSPRKPFVAHIHWAVRSGACWGITGLQGTGKTRVLEVIAGLHPFLEGRVEVYGQVLGQYEGDKVLDTRRKVGLLFDGNGRLFPSLSVYENIVLPWCYHRNLTPSEAVEVAEPLIRHLDLEPYLTLYPGRLSRGWSRRVALARTLILNPELLLLDDPLSGLDPTHTRWWREFLEMLTAGHPWFHQKPVTLIIATDDLQPLFSLAHQFAWIHDGKWENLGDRKDVETSANPLLQEMLHSRI